MKAMGTIGDIFHTLVKAYLPLTTNTLSLTVIAATEGCTHKSLSAKAKAIISEYSTGLLEGEMLAWQLSILIEMFVATLPAPLYQELYNMRNRILKTIWMWRFHLCQWIYPLYPMNGKRDS